MASEIKVDTIVNAGGDNDTGIDLATNDQILLKVANATKLTMNSTGQTTIVGEGGTTTTSIQQGLAKVWSTQSEDGTSTLDSFNVTSIADTATGKQTITFANDFSNANYCTNMSNTGGTTKFLGATTTTTGSILVYGFLTNDTNFSDTEILKSYLINYY